MNNKIKNLFILSIFLSFPFFVSADAVTDTIGKITDWILGISTALAVLMYVVGGFLWMSDAGSTERVKLAKSIIVSTTIGLVIILMAAAIANIVNSLVVRG